NASFAVTGSAALGSTNVTVTTLGGVSSPATLSVVSPGGFIPIRINANGPVYSDSAGQVWSADSNYTGSTGAASTSVTILNTADQTLYRTWRVGGLSAPWLTYTFPSIPAGNYAVRLKLEENIPNGSGQRIMKVNINGQTVLSNYDIYAAAGGANIA